MATLQAATTSRSATVTNPDAVAQLCDTHCFAGLKWRLSDDGGLSIWGYESFRIYSQSDDGTMGMNSEEVTHEFLWTLSEYIEEGDELDIQSAGFTKCRYPMYARRYVVRPGEVLSATLDGLDSLERGDRPQPP